MNTPNPLLPQGSLDQPESKAKSNIRMIILGVITLHCVFFIGLLMQGCKREDTEAQNKQNESSPVAVTQPSVNPTTEPYTYPSPPPVPAVTDTSVPSGPMSTAGTTPMTVNPVNPLPPAPEPTAVSTGAREHAIAKGDNYYSIAKKYNVSVKAITAANPNVDPTRMQIGQKLVIPEAKPAATAAMAMVNPGSSAAAPANPESSSPIYVVKGGDNLTKIAQKHGTTVGELRKVNNLRSDRINAGQKLKVPVKSATTGNVSAPTAAAPEATAVDTTAPAPVQ